MIPTGIFRYFIIGCQGTKYVSGHKRSRFCPDMIVTTCLGTNESGHKRVWAQTSLDTNMCGHKRVWAQTCVGTKVTGHNRVGSSMYGHKRVVSLN